MLDINQIWLKASSGKLYVPTTFAKDFSVPLRITVQDVSCSNVGILPKKLVTPLSAPCNGANEHFPSSKCGTPTSQFFMPTYKFLDEKYQIMQWSTTACFL